MRLRAVFDVLPNLTSQLFGRSGKSALDKAIDEGHTDCVAALEAAGAQRDVDRHASAVELHRTAGSVIVTRHRGGGCVTSDYMMQLQDFNTFVADVKLCNGCFYFELHAVDIADVVQFGFCTQGFEPREDAEGEGVGDDEWSWAIDGVRQMKWHEGDQGAHGSEWAVDDVIGIALDMRTAGAAIVSVSVNGSFAAPNGVAFSDIDAPYLSPAFTGVGRYRVNFGDRPFVNTPPDVEYVSVHEFNQQQQQQQQQQ